jgi:hypothetical protein
LAIVSGIRWLNEEERQPAIVYLHPWELDPDQPRLPIGRLARLRHTLNVAKTEAKLRRLLGDFEFAPASEILTDAGILAAGDAR